MNQEVLGNVLRHLGKLIDEARNSHTFAISEADIEIKLVDEWRGMDNCPWPGCEEYAYESLWRVKRGEMSVEVWEIMIHFAQAGHHISFNDRHGLSEEQQVTLLEIYR